MERSFAIFMTAVALGAFPLAGAGCGSDQDPAHPEADGGAGTRSKPTDGVPDAGHTPAFEPAFGAFDVAIHQAVTVGAFVLDLGSGHVAPGSSPFDPYATVSLDYVAHNLSTRLAQPLASLTEDGVLLETGGKYAYGDAYAQSVPGLLDGAGTVTWTINDKGLTVDALRNATMTLGQADQNQAVVVFSNPSATVSLADVPLDTRLSIGGYRKTTLEVTSARVQYNSRESNVPLPAGTAWLVLDGVLSADPDMSPSGAYWGKTNMFLTRPDGLSVAPMTLNEAIYPGDRQDVELIFELKAPGMGSYTFGVTAPNMPAVTHEIPIP